MLYRPTSQAFLWGATENVQYSGKRWLSWPLGWNARVRFIPIGKAAPPENFIAPLCLRERAVKKWKKRSATRRQALTQWANLSSFTAHAMWCLCASGPTEAIADNIDAILLYFSVLSKVSRTTDESCRMIRNRDPVHWQVPNGIIRHNFIFGWQPKLKFW